MMIKQKITIVRIRRPPSIDLNQELQWFGRMLGLFGERDRDRSCFRIFIELLKARKLGHGLSSDELARSLDLSRGTVVHHLNNLMSQGIIISDHRRYVLRADTLQGLIQELHHDAELAFRQLGKAAEELDNYLRL